jgi:hypothetical protein
MNTKNINKVLTLLGILLLSIHFIGKAQDTEKKSLILTVNYFMEDNRVVYLMSNAKSKIDGKFVPLKGITVTLFLDNDSASNLIGKFTTDKNGLVKSGIPVNLKTVWQAGSQHKFLAKSEANKEYDASDAEITISKSKIVIDTSVDGETKNITVKLTSFDGANWKPVPDVEMKVGVFRTVGRSILSAGDDATYTTDSSGIVVAEFKKVNLPGDEKGNLLLMAKVEENDIVGNLSVQKTVPWGVVKKIDNDFFKQRALWATRFRTPIWLLFMAYSIVFGVWGTIVYLVLQLIKIKK